MLTCLPSVVLPQYNCAHSRSVIVYQHCRAWYKCTGCAFEDTDYRPTSPQPESAPVAFRPKMMPIATTCPIVPRYNTSVAVKPAGSPVCRPDLFSTSFSPGVDSLLALGVKPKRPAARKRVVDARTIRLLGDPRNPSARTTIDERRAGAAFTACTKRTAGLWPVNVRVTDIFAEAIARR